MGVVSWSSKCLLSKRLLNHKPIFLLLNMVSHKTSKPSKKTMEKKSSKIIKKKRSKKSKEGQKKRTAPAALVKVMNVSNDLADIIGMKKASRPEAIKALWAYIKKNNLQSSSKTILHT